MLHAIDTENSRNRRYAEHTPPRANDIGNPRDSQFILSEPPSGIELNAERPAVAMAECGRGQQRCPALRMCTPQFRLIRYGHELSGQLEAMTQVRAAGSDGSQFQWRSVTIEAMPQHAPCTIGALAPMRDLALVRKSASRAIPNGCLSPCFILPPPAAASRRRALPHRNSARRAADIVARAKRPSELAIAGDG